MARPLVLVWAAMPLLAVVLGGPMAPAESTAQTIVTITVPTPTPRPKPTSTPGPTATPRPPLTFNDCDGLENEDHRSLCYDQVYEEQWRRDREDAVDRGDFYDEEDHGPRW